MAQKVMVVFILQLLIPIVCLGNVTTSFTSNLDILPYKFLESMNCHLFSLISTNRAILRINSKK